MVRSGFNGVDHYLSVSDISTTCTIYLGAGSALANKLGTAI